MRARIAFAAATIALASSAQAADEFEAPLRALAESDLRAWLAEPGLLAALRAQNLANGALSQISMTVVDPSTGEAPGAATFGVDV